MAGIKNMPATGVAVTFIIVALFILAVIVLFHTYLRYKRLSAQLSGGTIKDNNGFLRTAVNKYAESYKKFGTEVNTPAIIENTENIKLGGLKLCERFLNNAVSLFVTLGLFGTFLGLSLSVSSLTELISTSNTSEWLSVLDSVGGGLMSALSGMGVAFYTSLVGVACSIVLTILRSIFSPSGARETMETRLELWLDESVAPSLPTDAVKDEIELGNKILKSLNATTEATAKNLEKFNETIETFNSGMHDFSEIEYSLRGTIERLDLAVRDIGRSVKGER